MSRTSSRLLVALALVLAFLCSGFTAVYAGTTGALTGKVINAATQAPMPGAKVTVASPSGSATTVSDKNGSFAFLSLAPDTYALSVSYAGFDTATTSGITVQSDQTATFNVTLAKSLQTIGRVQSRSNASLIQPGVSTDVYNIGVAQQRAAATLGGGGGLNNAYSAIASVPGVFVPQGQNGTYQSIFVRGSNYTQVGYEYDGVPIQRSFDQYPGGNLSSLGQQEVQVYVGSAPTGTGSTALAGFINQVIRTGTYPGFANAQLGFGGPSKYANIRLEGGGASPDRNFNYYIGTGGYHQDLLFQRVTEYDKIYGSQLDVYKTNCTTNNGSAGCYANTALAGGPLGPNGYQLGPLFWGASTYQTDRDTVANFHWGIPHKRSNDGGRDDIQLLYNTTLVQTYFATAPTDWGTFLDAINNGTYGGAPTCATAASTNCNLFGATPGVYIDKQIYNGPTGTFLTAGDLGNTAPSYFPGSPANRSPSRPGSRVAQDPFERDNYQQSGAIVKLQYQRNINSRSYARIYGYSEYSDWLQYGQGGFAPSFVGSISSDYKLGSHTRGLDFTYANQINDKHLLNFNASYTTSTTFRNNNAAVNPSGATTAAASTTVAFMVDSRNPTNGICYNAAGVGVNCSSGNSIRYVLPAAGLGGLVPSNPAVTLANAGAITCGTGPCAFFSVANGNAASYNTVTPKFTAVSLSDKFQVNDKLSLDLGLRYDDFKYVLVNTDTGPARQFWVNYFNKWNCFDNGTQILVTRPTVAGAPGPCPLSAVGGATTVPATFSLQSDAQEDYPELQPRFGATYTINRNNVIRVSAGKYAQPASSAFQQYNTSNPNFLALNQTFYPIGFHQPSHRIYPEESYNYDASWEHQFNGTDTSFKFTPYVRNTKNELTTVLLDAKTNFVSGINVGRKSVKGIEFQINKGDLAKDGFYGSLGYTYTFARIRFDKFTNGTDINTSLNNAVALYNSYTSFCGANPSDARCRVFGTPTTTQANPGFAVPCFKAGVPDPACTAGSIANPYYNLPVQNLYDPNGVYPVYNTYSGSLRGTGSNQSYIPPHVLTFIGNYKHGKFNITPTAQFQGGSQYGRPLQVSGVNPTTCSPLAGAGTTTAGDPRYPGTQPGSPYDAASCGGAIVIPNPFIGHFDNYGQYTEPNRLALNLSLSYDLSKQVSFKVDMVNVTTSCWGGSNVPWKVGGRAGCDYGGGTFASNFYNPGDVIQAGYNQPYAPTFGNVFQSTAGGQANPFQVYATINIKM
jgi:Carboxypeptidase regulatory-like domain/TonB dependent receptor-like, beta-barrel/TonB-dependent Receptor Plug Domain